MSPVKTSLRLNNDVDPHTLVAVAVAAEVLGFDEIWVSHDLFLRSAPVLLAVVAQATQSIGIGTAILNPYSMHPAEITMIAATLQEVSGGRFRLGIAAGAKEFLAWAGIDRSHPLARTREAVIAIRTLLNGGRPAEIPDAGNLWQDEAYLPIPPAPTPIYLGGMSPQMLELAGEVADGVLPLLFPPEHFPVAFGQIRAGARRAGRDLSSIDVAACIWCSVDEDPNRAREALARKIAYYGPSFAPYLLRRVGLEPEDFDSIREASRRGDMAGATRRVTPRMLALGVAGCAEEVAQRCLGLIDLGATHISFGPPLGPDILQAVHTLGRRVLPHIRRRG